MIKTKGECILKIWTKYLRLNLYCYFLIILSISVTICYKGCANSALPKVWYAGVFVCGEYSETSEKYPYISKALLENKNESHQIKSSIVKAVMNSFKRHADKIKNFQLIFPGEDIDDSEGVRYALGLLLNNEYLVKQQHTTGNVINFYRVTGMLTIIDYESQAIIASFPFIYHNQFNSTIDNNSYLNNNLTKILGFTKNLSDRVHGERITGSDDSNTNNNIDCSLMGYIEDFLLKKVYLPKTAGDDSITAMKIGAVTLGEKIFKQLNLSEDYNKARRYKEYLADLLGSCMTKKYGVSVLPYSSDDQALNKIYRVIYDGLPFVNKRKLESGMIQNLSTTYLINFKLKNTVEKVVAETAQQKGLGIGVFATVKLFEETGEGEEDADNDGKKSEIFNYVIKYGDGEEDSIQYERIWGSNCKYVDSFIMPKRVFASVDMTALKMMFIDRSIEQDVLKFGKKKTPKAVIDYCLDLY